MPTIENLTISLTAAGIAVDDLVVVVDVSEANERKRAQKMRIDQLAIATGALLAGTYQPLDGDLTAIAALTTTAFGRGLLTEVSAATLRTTLTVYSTTQVDAADTAVAAAASAALAVHTGNVSNPHAVTKTQVGLGSVENTTLSTWAGSTALTTLGTVTVGTFPLANLSGAGAGVLNALAVNVGLAGAPVLFNGAGGTPSSLTLTNATGYPGTSALVTVGALTSGSIGGSFGAINVGANAITGGAISGTTGTFTGNVTLDNAASPTLILDRGASTDYTTIAFKTAGATTGGWQIYGTNAVNQILTVYSEQAATTVGSWNNLGYNGVIGATTPAAGSFTTLGASGAIAGGTGYFGAAGYNQGAMKLIAVNATSGPPATSGSTQTYGAFRIAPLDSNGCMDFGGNSATPWIQATNRSDHSIFYTLALNPNGGAVTMGGGLAVTGTLTTTGNGSYISYSGVGAGMRFINTDNTSGSLFIQFNKSDATGIGSVSRVATTDAIAFNTTSAREVKENIEDMRTWAQPMDLLNCIPIRVWDWRTFGRDKRPDDLANCGVIYDEVYPIFPDACTPGKPGKDKSGAPLHPDSVDYSKFVPLCIAGLQDHDRELTDHEKRIAALEKELAGLKAA